MNWIFIPSAVAVFLCVKLILDRLENGFRRGGVYDLDSVGSEEAQGDNQRPGV